MEKSKNNIEKIYLLTPMQEGMLFHSVKDKSDAYFDQLFYTTTGEIDLKIFSESLDVLSKRHDILRTAFAYEKTERPIQVVLRNRKIAISILDKSSLNNTDYNHFLEEYKNEDIKKGFDLVKKPLIRISIIKRSETVYDFLWSYHHILLDGWCHAILVEELGKIYESLKTNTVLDLPEPIHFDSYVKWLEKKDASESKNYWKTYLNEYDHIAEIPKVVNHDFSELKNPQHTIKFSKQISEKLAIIVKDHAITQNDIFQAIWGLLLAKYSNSNDVVYGNVVSGRPAELKGVERCLGLFINTIPVRFQYKKEQTLIALAKKNHEDFLDGMPHHYNSLAEIQNETGLKTDLIKHVIAFENYPLSEINDHESEQLFKVSNVDAFDRTNYDFDVDIELAEEIKATFYYNPDDYHPDYIEKIATTFKVLTHQFAENPAKEIKELNFISEKNTEELLHHFNQKEIDLNNTAPVNVLFENQTLLNNNAVSVIHNTQKWTYKQLNTKANKIANTLIKNGLEKGNFVGLHLERCPELVAALLGIFKAGGIYVPLDTQNPATRTLELIKDGEINALISDCNQLNILTKTGSFSDNLKQVLCIDGDIELLENTLILSNKDTIEDNNITNPENTNAITDWAYMLYTSGSTGKPKGAITRYDGAINHILAEYKALDLQDGFCFLQSASIASDISVWQILAPLLKGGTVLIAAKDDVLDYQKTLHLMKEHNVTIAEFVPSYLIGFVDHILELESHQNILPSLAWMMMVGEEIPVKLVNNWLQLFPNCKVLNGYGPCEASDDITQYEITGILPEYTPRVPIGKPIHNMNIFVLDDNEKLIPIGVAGEICVSGVGVGAGYFNEPEKTAQSFRPNPFTNTLGETMYKTGDLGRWLPDGNLEFLGRKDRQVKIRGNRVELGEIEAFIREDYFIENVAVIAYKKSPSDISLIAFVIKEHKNLTEEEQLKTVLFEKSAKGLPYYMQPTEYCFVDVIPQNLSDKVDEKKLIALYKERTNNNTNSTKEIIPCKTETEKAIKAIWEHILQKTEISATDDFFEKGGHSLLAMRVKSAIFKRLKIDLDIRDLFVYTKLNELAKHVDQNSISKESSKIGIQEKPIKIPLSYAQESLWFIDNLQGNTTEYNISASIKLKGNLNISLLEASLQAIINRHETLRSIVLNDSGIPYLSFLETENWTLNIINESYGCLDTTIEELVSQSFNLATDFKLKASIIKQNSTENILVLVMHHIASDGWSESILVEELLAFYEAGLNNVKANVSELPIQYSDYILWQQKNKAKLDNQITYWKENLKDITTLELPTDYERPKIQSTNGSSLEVLIDKKVLTSLKKLSITNGVTLYMTLLAAYKVLLSKYSGQNDIAIGTPIAGRTNQELEKLIGFFVNTLVIRSTVNSDINFNDFLKDVKNTALNAYKNQDTPFEKVVETVVKQRDLSRNPLFQVMFTLQNTPDLKEIKLGDLDATFINSDYLQVQSDLHFLVEETPKGDLTLEIEYCSDIFERTTIEKLATYYTQLLAEIIENSSQKIKNLPLINEQEKKLLLHDFNTTTLDFSKDETILDILNNQVEKNPNAIAILHHDESITYEELNAKSNQVAQYLIEKGITKETLVPICMERNILTVISIFGILKAGAVYVPIGSNNPSDRISFIIEDTNAKLVITSSDILEKINFSSELDLVIVDTITDELAQYPSENTGIKITQNNLAYIIYTSGTTGKPKGVMIEHKGLYSFVAVLQETHPLHEQETMAFKTNFGFDMSIIEIFGWLKGGASMVIISEDVVKNPNLFIQELITKKITYLSLVPTYFSVFLDYIIANNTLLPNLRYLEVGGEALPVNTAKKYLSSKLTAKLDNMYGPSEITVYSNYHPITELAAKANTVPIGKPTANANIYILSNNLEILPIGIIGEICIGGLGVARGYLNRPELTSEKFIENPFVKGERIYKSGDLGKWLPDGSVVYAGRKDSQVKIRGYRIELAEIETLLDQENTIKQSVVITTNSTSNKQLIAYLIAGVSAVDTKEIQANLSLKLPEYMVPKTYVLLDEFPIDNNGKINRKKLQEITLENYNDTNYLAPTSEIEEKLSVIWKNLLQLTQVSITDNFFELGGHSILAMRAIFDIQKELNVGIDLKLLFQNPTIQQLAKQLETSNLGYEKIPEIIEASSYETSQAQKRIWLATQAESNPAVYNITIAFQIEGNLVLERLKKAINYVIIKHEILRTNFIDIDGIPYQKIHAFTENKSNFNIIETEDIYSKATDVLIKEENHEFNLASDALIRFRLITNTKENIFVVNLHHIIGDGWSVQTLQEDVLKAYEKLSITNNLPNEKLAIQYKEYASWHNKQLNNEDVEAAKYWLNVLKGVTERSELPLDKIRRNTRETLSKSLEFSLGKELSLKIKELSNVSGIRKFILLQALLKTYLAQYTNSKDIVLGTPVAGRNHFQLQDQIGCYINVLALRSQIINENSFNEIVEQINTETEVALKYDSYPYDILVNRLNSNRQSTRNPLFDILISYDENISSENKSELEFIELNDSKMIDNHNKYDITYAFETNTSGEIIITIKYLTSLFYDSTITAMRDQMKIWFELAMSNPNEPLKDCIQSITTEVDLVDDFI